MTVPSRTGPACCRINPQSEIKLRGYSENKDQSQNKSKVKGDGQECPSHTSYSDTSVGELRRGEDDFGMEEGAGYSGGDGDEVALAGEDFDLAGAGKIGEIDGASAADAGGGGFVGGNGRKLRQELAGMDEEGFDSR